MSTDSFVVRARIPVDIKNAAVANLRKMGLTTSDLIRLTFFHVAHEGTFPFDLKVPRSVNLDAMTKEEFEQSLTNTFEEEAQGKFQYAEEVFSELRKEPLR